MSDGFDLYPDLYINVNVDAGAGVHAALGQMAHLATRLGFSVWAGVNGVRVLARPGDNASELVAAWETAREKRWAFAATTKLKAGAGDAS